MTQQPPTPQEDKGTALANDWLEMQDTTTQAIVATLLSQERTRLKEEIEQLVIEDVPHRYQERLLAALSKLTH